MFCEEDKVNEQTQEQDIQIPIHTFTKRKVLQKQKKSTNTKLSTIDNSLDDAVRALREVSSSSRSSNNEFTMFGQLVATQLAQLPLEIAITLQQEFQTKINEARLKHLRSCSKTTSLSSPSTMSLSLNSSENSYELIPHESQYVEVSSNAINVEEQPSLHNYYSNWDNYTNV